MSESLYGNKYKRICKTCRKMLLNSAQCFKNPNVTASVDRARNERDANGGWDADAEISQDAPDLQPSHPGRIKNGTRGVNENNEASSSSSIFSLKIFLTKSNCCLPIHKSAHNNEPGWQIAYLSAIFISVEQWYNLNTTQHHLTFLTSTSSLSWDMTLSWELLTSPSMSELDLLSFVASPGGA